MREEDDAGDEVGVCGGEGEADLVLPRDKPPSRRREWEGSSVRQVAGVLVRGVADDDRRPALWNHKNKGEMTMPRRGHPR